MSEEDLQDRYLRALAELENQRKRHQEELRQVRQQGWEDGVKTVLPAGDTLMRARQAVGQKTGRWTKQEVRETVQALSEDWDRTLEQRGIAPFQSEGASFDPRVHDAVAELPANGTPPGVVVGEISRGYRLGDKVIRPAQVAVTVDVKKDL